MLVVPSKPARRRNETRDLTKPIEAALNALPGVWACRNTVGTGYHRNGDPATWGLGNGSADVIGCVAPLMPWLDEAIPAYFFALEVKWPGVQPTKQQLAWHSVMRERRAFVAVVHSVEEALDAVDRCRRGKMS